MEFMAQKPLVVPVAEAAATQQEQLAATSSLPGISAAAGASTGDEEQYVTLPLREYKRLVAGALDRESAVTVKLIYGGVTISLEGLDRSRITVPFLENEAMENWDVSLLPKRFKFCTTEKRGNDHDNNDDEKYAASDAYLQSCTYPRKLFIEADRIRFTEFSSCNALAYAGVRKLCYVEQQDNEVEYSSSEELECDSGVEDDYRDGGNYSHFVYEEDNKPPSFPSPEAIDNDSELFAGALQDLRLKHALYNPFVPSLWEFSSTVVGLAVSVANSRAGGNARLFKFSFGEHVRGSEAYGRLDWAVRYRGRVVCIVADGKKDGINGGLYRNLAQLVAASEQGLCDNDDNLLPLFGIATTYMTWTFLRWDRPPRAGVGRRQEASCSIQSCEICTGTIFREKSTKDVAEHILGILLSQKGLIDDAAAARERAGNAGAVHEQQNQRATEAANAPGAQENPRDATTAPSSSALARGSTADLAAGKQKSEAEEDVDDSSVSVTLVYRGSRARIAGLDRSKITAAFLKDEAIGIWVALSYSEGFDLLYCRTNDERDDDGNYCAIAAASDDFLASCDYPLELHVRSSSGEEVVVSELADAGEALAYAGVRDIVTLEGGNDVFCTPFAIAIDGGNKESEGHLARALLTDLGRKHELYYDDDAKFPWREFISSVLHFAAAAATQEVKLSGDGRAELSRGHVELSCDEFGWTVSYKNRVICIITQGEKDDGLYRNLAQLAAAAAWERDLKKRAHSSIDAAASSCRRIFGIATTYMEWIFLRLDDEPVGGQRSAVRLAEPKRIDLSTDTSREETTKAVADYIVDILLYQKATIDAEEQSGDAHGTKKMKKRMNR